jgi:hypothetical protein
MQAPVGCFDPIGSSKDGEVELTRGRLSMIATMAQDGLTGSAWVDWDLYSGSPLR